jgi:hypothetical protein
LCSNRAATQTNVLKPQEKDQRDNMLICRCFAHSGNRQQCIVLLSYGRGHWFDPSIAHSEKVVLQEKLKQRLAYQTFVEPVCSNVEKAAT